MSEKGKNAAFMVLGGILAIPVVAALIIIGLMNGLLPFEIKTRIVGAPVCQGIDQTGLQFTAETENVRFAAITESNEGRGVVYRRRANTSSDYDVAGRLLPGNCQVAFVGFCIGESGKDLTGGDMFDQQWFILPDQRGYIHGGVVQELAPGTIGQKPGKCPGGAQEPRTIALTRRPTIASDGTLELRFRAPHAITIGVAGKLRTGQGEATWQQLGVDADGSDGFIVLWKPSQKRAASTPLVYSVCWAGNVPGRASGQMLVDPAGGTSSDSPKLKPNDLRDALSVACRQTAGGS
jgi:hypothetical protein